MKYLQNHPYLGAVMTVMVLTVFSTSISADFFSNLGKTRVNGRTYERLAAEWYEHYISFADAEHPGLSVGESDCGASNRGLIWFLATPPAQFGGFSPIELECTVKRRVLFFPAITIFYANFPQDDPPADEAFKRFANESVTESACVLQVSLDGEPLEYSVPIVRSQSNAFHFSAEDGRNIFFVPPGTDDPETYADGHWVALPPLSPGEHVLHYRSGVLCDENSIPLFSHDVTYRLTVVGGP